MKVKLFALVPNAPLPYRAGASTRAPVPAGYGVQEQCLPFTAACALGLLIPAPFDFGFCMPAEVPPAGRAFSPPAVARQPGDARQFYVVDQPLYRFAGNCFDADALPFTDADGHQKLMHPRFPGISFMDRSDQAELFKLHLPWVLRTASGVDSFFCDPVNRRAPLELLAGLVETDWYAHPVNLVARRPATGPVHVRAGDVIGQVMFVERDARRVQVEVVERGSESAREHRDGLLQWFNQHRQDRSAYKRLARSRQGRIGASSPDAPEDDAGPT